MRARLTLWTAIVGSVALTAAVGRAQTTAATAAADAIDNLNRAVTDRINSEVEVNARAFADAQNIQASLVWSDWFRTAFDISVEALEGLEAIQGPSDLKDSDDVRLWLRATITGADKGKSALSILGSLDRLKQDGANLAIDIDGPAYSILTRNMLDEAYSTSSIFYFDYEYYHDSVMNTLLGTVPASSPLRVSHKSTALDRSGGNVFNSILDARSYISNQLSGIATQLRQTQMPPDRIAELTSFINTRRQDVIQSGVGASHVSYDAFLSSGSSYVKRHVAYCLGTITLLEQWRGTVLDEFTESAGFDSIGISGRFVEAAGSFVTKGIDDVTETINLNLSVDAVIAGRAGANHVLADATSLGFSLYIGQIGDLADEQYTLESNSREQINMIPQQMMDSLPGEVSKLLLLVDDTVQYAQISATAATVSSTSPSTLITEPLPQTQLLKIFGSGFTATSTLTFNDGVNPPYTGKIPNFVNSSELDYNIAVGATPATWTVSVVNNGQTSSPYTFFVLSGAAQLTGIAISGPGTIPENGTGQFTATAYFTDGTSQTVTPSAIWSENSSATTISTSGILSASAVNSDTTVNVSASYTFGGITKTSSTTAVILNSGTSSGTQILHPLVNGTFEAGTSPWAPSGYAGILAGSYPHNDSWYAYLCNDNDAAGSFSQFFPVPAATTAASLAFYLNIVTEETTTVYAFDTMKVDLVTGGDQYIGTVFQFSNLDKGANVPGNYVYKSADIMSLISPYRGQSIYLVFSGVTDDLYKTIFRIDDVDITLTVTNPVSLTGLSIRGPSSIPEGRGDTFWADAIFSDGTTQTISPNSWNEDSPATTISSDGFLLAGSVSSDTPVTVTASYTFNGQTQQAAKTVTIVDTNAPRVLTYLAITGPTSVNENSTGQFNATAIFSDGFSQPVAASWSQTAASANISVSGVLTTGNVENDTTTTVSASYTTDGVTKGTSQSVSILNIPLPASLSSLNINGPVSVNESNVAQYSATAFFTDGTSQNVTPVWTGSGTSANISSSGILTAYSVSADTNISITASYTTGAVSRTVSKTITVINTNEPALFTLSVDSEHGAVAATPVRASYASNSQVSLTALADSGYIFNAWSGSINSSANPLSVTVSTNLSLTASFVLRPPQNQLIPANFATGSFTFVLNGSAGSNYVVEVSSNLIAWTPLVTNTLPVGNSVLVTDHTIPIPSQRFYRAVPSSATGLVATVIATGLVSPSNLALDGSDVYFADNTSSNGFLKRVLNSGGDPITLVSGLTTTDGQLAKFTISSTNVYGGFGGDGQYDIFRAPKAGGTYSTLAAVSGGTFIGTDGTVIYYSNDHTYLNIMTAQGDNQTELISGNWVRSSAIDDNDIYFVDFGSKELRKYDLSLGTTTTLIGSNATEGSIFSDTTNIYFNLSGTLKQIDKRGGPVTTLVGSGAALGYASDGQKVFFVETNTLKSIPVGGGAASTLIAIPPASLTSVATDNQFIYWTDVSGGPGAGKILRTPKL